MTAAEILLRHDLLRADGRGLHLYGAWNPNGAGEQPGGAPAGPPTAPQLRFDLLTDAWVAISPERNTRPDVRRSAERPAVRCPLCPGGPEVPFDYQAAVFDNRFPALFSTPPPVPVDPWVAPARGRCEMVLYTPRHRGSLASLTPEELARVVAIWRDRSTELWANPVHRFVMAFENHGRAVGATLTHPHGQIYAFDRLPPLISARITALHGFRERTHGCASCETVARDEPWPRLVAGNPSFTIAVPFAPRWPFEVHVRARRHGLRRLADLASDEQRDLAAALRQVVVRYRGIYGHDLPYMMAILEAPEGEEDWHLAVEFYPPHRSRDLTKIRASVETATGFFLNDTLPESQADLLRQAPGPRVTERPALRVVRASR